MTSVNPFGANVPSKSEIDSKLSALGIPKEVIAKGKAAVEEYAQEHGITLPSPPDKPADNLFDMTAVSAINLPDAGENVDFET